MKKISLLYLIAFGNIAMAITPDNYTNLAESWQKHQKIVSASNFKDLPWRNIGPIVQGGRVVAVRVSNQDDNIMYIAYASGGVWKSTNKGMTFEPITDKLPSQIVGGLAIDPKNDQILYLGTGENNSSRSSYAGMGVYKSMDGGDNWQYIGLGSTSRIGDILVDPNNSNRIYVAALGALYSKGSDRGVFVSEDAGKTWNKVLNGDNFTGFVDLSIASNGDVYASAWQRMRKSWDFVESGEGSKIYKSADHGKTWKALTNGLPTGKFVGRMGVDVAQSDSKIVYVVVDNQEVLPENQWDLGDSAVNAKRLKTMTREDFLMQDTKNIESFLKSNNFPPEDTAEVIIKKIKDQSMSVQDLVKSLKDANNNLFNTDIKGLEVYRSDDAGASFHKTHDLPLSGVVFTYGYYFGKIHVDPNDANTIYTMGVPLIKSIDGGKQWSSLYDPKVHVDYHEVWIDPRNSQHIIAANDGGADESYDGGDNWRKLDFQPVGQFYTVALDDAEPYNVYGGLQDNGTLKGSSQTDWTDGESWKRIFGGDGMHIGVDDDIVYVGYQFGNNFRLEDGKPTQIKPSNYINEAPLRYNWNTPLMLSSHNKDIIYFGANKLFRSFDRGETFKAISKDLTQSFKRGDVPYATITSISESPLQFGRIIVGTDDGMVWVTNDDGNNWKNVTKKLPKKLWVSRVIASQHNKKVLWLTLNNYRNDDIQSYVYRSDNFGKSWKSISKGLPNEAVNVIKEDPSNKKVVYIGTDKGLYVSLNSGTNWTTLGAELPTVPVHDIAIHARDKELVAATHGRSMWVTDISAIQNHNEFKNKSLAIIKAADINFRDSWNSKPSRWFVTPKDKAISTFSFWSDSEKSIQISIRDNHNQSIYADEIKLHKGFNSWEWDNKIDTKLALSAENYNNKKEVEKNETNDEKERPFNLSQTPISEGVRLGHEIYIQKGEYQIEISYKNDKVLKSFSVK